MGLYPIDCPSCKKPYMWFSGNLPDQRCGECRDKYGPVRSLDDHRLLKDSGKAIDGIQDLVNEAFVSGDVEFLQKIMDEIDPIVQKIKQNKENE